MPRPTRETRFWLLHCNTSNTIVPSVFREATITHLDLPSTCVHQDSAEGAAQLQKEREENNKFRRKSTMAEANAEDFDAAKEKERKKKKVKSKYHTV